MQNTFTYLSQRKANSNQADNLGGSIRLLWVQKEIMWTRGPTYLESWVCDLTTIKKNHLDVYIPRLMIAENLILSNLN